MAKTIDLNIPKSAAERLEKSEGLRSDYIAMMRAHVDEGGNLSHRNGLDLLAEVERLRTKQPSPPADRREIVARIINTKVGSKADPNFVERRWLTGVDEAADAILAALDGGR